VGDLVSFEDRDGMGNTISRIDNDTSGSSGSVKGKNGLDLDVHGGNFVFLEHDLTHLLSVGLRV